MYKDYDQISDINIGKCACLSIYLFPTTPDCVLEIEPGGIISVSYPIFIFSTKNQEKVVNKTNWTYAI